jgi:hypothetical protein
MLFVSIMNISKFVITLKPSVQCELSKFLKNVNTIFLLIEPNKIGLKCTWYKLYLYLLCFQNWWHLPLNL